jgi:hypothetical protein
VALITAACFENGCGDGRGDDLLLGEDFLHLLAYLYDAAHAYRCKDVASGWKTYEQWLRWAWPANLRGATETLSGP